jgi:hypothetical protein
MCHIGLEPERLGPANQFQQLDYSFPAVNASPTNLAFDSKAFAVIFGNGAGIAKGSSDEAAIPRRIFCPLRRAASRIDPNNAIVANAKLTKSGANTASLFHLD